MGKWRKILTVSAWVLVIGLILSPFFYIQINKMLYEIRVKHYLMEEKG